jgi:hypothetical protein
VSATVVFWVILPELAVMVTICKPTGVPGVGGVVGAVGGGVEATGAAAGFVALEQPTATPAKMTRRAKRLNNCKGCDLPMARRRVNTRREPKGRRNATVRTAESLVQGACFWRRAMLAAVWMVTVLVAAAVGVTERVLGEKVQVTPTGPLQDKFTLPLKLLVGVTLMVAIVELPAVTVAAEVEALKPKADGAVDDVMLAMPAKRPWASLVRPAAM